MATCAARGSTFRLSPLWVCGWLMWVGCDTPPDPEAQADARARVEAAVAAADHVRSALEFLGILPTYACGEPRATFVGDVVSGIHVKLPCADVSTQAFAEKDEVRLTFDRAGCAVSGETLGGAALLEYAGGEDRFSLNADLRSLELDGERLELTAGYGTCGDEQRVWASAEGRVPRRPDLHYRLDGEVGIRDGMPLLGSTQLVLNGPGEIRTAEGVDRLTLEQVQYEVGQYLPKGGTLRVETSSGHHIRASFTPWWWRFGQAEIEIDSHAPVVLPIVR